MMEGFLFTVAMMFLAYVVTSLFGPWPFLILAAVCLLVAK